MTGSHYGKPNKTIHIGNVRCHGNEENLQQCSKTTYSLEEGKQLQQDTDVAGVSCIPVQETTRIARPTPTTVARPTIARPLPTSSAAEPNQGPSSAASSSNPSMSGSSVVTLVLLCIVFVALIVSVR